ncbi:MAG: Flp family type IVb pilin [Pseudomonadota bacterium]
MKQKFNRLVRNKRGATSIEYALIGSLISLAVVVGATGIGINLTDGFTELHTLLADGIATASGGGGGGSTP